MIRRSHLALFGAQLLAGVAIGLIWLAWAPRTTAYLLAGANKTTYILPDETESRIAGDGRFVLLSLAAGLIFGLVAWRLRRSRGPVMLLVLAAGSVLGSLLARTVGQALAPGSNTGPVNSAIRPPLTLHSFAPIWVQALLAVLVYTAFVGISGDDNLGRTPAEPEQPVFAEQPS